MDNIKIEDSIKSCLIYLGIEYHWFDGHRFSLEGGLSGSVDDRWRRSILLDILQDLKDKASKKALQDLIAGILKEKGIE